MSTSSWYQHFRHNDSINDKRHILFQKQPSRGVLRKRCPENMQQIYRRTPMPKCDFNKVSQQLYWNHTSACETISGSFWEKQKTKERTKKKEKKNSLYVLLQYSRFSYHYMRVKLCIIFTYFRHLKVVLKASIDCLLRDFISHSVWITALLQFRPNAKLSHNKW